MSWKKFKSENNGGEISTQKSEECSACAWIERGSAEQL